MRAVRRADHHHLAYLRSLVFTRGVELWRALACAELRVWVRVMWGGWVRVMRGVARVGASHVGMGGGARGGFVQAPSVSLLQ